ncbi:MAG: preprotein translocase subunit SecE [Candidatus Auribacterota bacterium]
MAKEVTKNQAANVNDKNIKLTFVVAGIIAWFPVSSLLLTLFDLSAQWVPNPKVMGMVYLSNIISGLICAGGAYMMIRSEAIYQFTNEVYIELGKVSWPFKQGTAVSNWEKFRELRESTLVVLFSIVVLAFVVGIIDTVFQIVMNTVF